MQDLFDFFFDGGRFIQRDCCGDWEPGMKTLYIRAQLAIVMAYFVLPVSLFIVKSGYKKLFTSTAVRISFGLFVLFCGIGHLEGYIAFFWPAYHAFAVWHAMTALVSWWTVIVLLTHSAREHVWGED